jgi:protease-4
LPQPADGIGLTWGSAADTDRPLAIRLNPAGLAFQPAWGLQYVHADSGIPFQGPNLGDGDALFLSFKPLPFLATGLGLQLLYPSPQDANNERVGWHTRLTLSNALRVGSTLSLGFNFHFFLGEQPAIQQLIALDVGLVFRPFNWVSLGLMSRNINTPAWDNAFVTRKWELSLALRPLLDERWVLSFDVQIPESGEGLSFLYRTEFQPVAGLRLGLRASHGADVSSFQAGLFVGFSFGKWGLDLFGQAAVAPGQTPAVGFGGLYASLWFSDALYPSLAQPAGRMPMLDLGGSLPERVNQFPLGGVQPLFLRILMALERVERDRSVGGIVLRLGGLRCGMAKIQELRQAIARIRKKKKKVVVYLTSATLKGYYLASAADKVYIYPNGSVQFGGLMLQHLFYADFLQQLGIKAQFVKFGKYKTGPNQYTHNRMTPAHKESYGAVLKSLFSQLMNDVKASRKTSLQVVKGWTQHGWFTARDAKQKGLVDGLVYWEKVMPTIHKELGSHLWLDPSYFQEQRTRSRWRGRDKIAVLHVDGAIVSGSGMDDPIFGTRLSGSGTIVRHLLQALYEPSIRAVVLRVDSPGGGVLASDMIWRYVKRLAKHKPVVVSMGTVAASGGYYISAPATEIFANAGTLTGSIGIYAGKFDFSGLLKHLGIRVQFQQKGKMAGIFSPYRPYSPHQRKRLKSYIKAGYEAFLQKVLEGRKKTLTMKKLRAIAAGRVWSGEDAKKMGLVDRIGGLWDAIQRAKQLANISRMQSIQLVSWPNQGQWRIDPRSALGLKATTSLARPKPNTDPLGRLLQKATSAMSPGQRQGPMLAKWIKQWRALLRSLQQTQTWAMQPQLLYVP